MFNNLIIISRALSDIQTGKEAKCLYFIGAVLFHLVPEIDQLDNAKRVDILKEELMSGDNIIVDGYFEDIIQRGNKRICVVEAKKDDFDGSESFGMRAVSPRR